MESIYFKIIGVSLVLTVSCGSKLWSVDQCSGKLLPEDFLGNRHVLSISSNVQNRTSDEVFALDYILYLIDIQNKKDACLNAVFNYTIKGLPERDENLAPDVPDFDASQPRSTFSLIYTSSFGFTRHQNRLQLPFPSDCCKNPVRAGPLSA